MAVKGRYIPDPNLDSDGLDLGLFDNDCGFDEAPIRAGSEEELEMFQSLVKLGLKPEDRRWKKNAVATPPRK